MKVLSLARFVLLVLLFGPLLPAPANAQPTLLIPNAGFEDGDNDLPGWSFNPGEGGEGDWSWETRRVHSGKRSLRLRKSNVAGYSMLVSDYLPVEAGKEYEVRAWVQVEGRPRANVYFMVSQYTADSPEMCLPNAFSTPRPLYTGDGWKQLRVRFPVRPGSARIRIHALISQAPAAVLWDDFELGPATEEVYAPRYEKPRPEELPPLEKARERLQHRKRAVAEGKVIDGRARLFFDGKPTEPAFYVAPFHNQWNAQIADFRDAGVRVYLLPLTLGRGVYSDRGPWIGAGKMDFSEVDELLWRILRVDPDGYILFYLATDPYREWGEEHPTEVCTDQDGRKAVVQMHPKDWGREPDPKARERYAPSLVSSVLRRDTIEAIRGLIRHVNASLPGKAVAGYHIAGLNDGQFFQWARHNPKDLHLADYSEASRKAFRDWLRRFYGNDLAAFRRAWDRQDLTFETAEIPSGERRLAPGFFLTLPRDQDIADYNRFYSEGTVETIHAYARVVKEETRGQALVSTYWEDACANVDSHLATGRMLQSPDIDFLAGPAAYGVRMAGEVGQCHSTWGSVGLHGRIKLTEQDWRSWLSEWRDPYYDYSVGRAENAADHNAMVRRECGMMLAYGHGTWWYDMSGGWFRDDQIMRGIAEARAAFSRDLKLSGRPRADVAVFVDERSFDFLRYRAAGPFRYEGIVRQLYQLNQSGVPYHLYLQLDLCNKSLPEYRLYLFLNAHHLSPAEKAAIKALRRAGKTLAFVHAPGVVGEADQAAAITEITGIRVRSAGGETRLTANVAPTAGPLNPGDAISSAALMGPAFVVQDEKARAVGTYPEGGTAVAARDFGTWKSLFFGPIGMTDSFLNALARWAGAWVAAPAGDAVYASQYFLTIHALVDGEKKLTLATPSRVEDLTTGKIVSERTQNLSFPMRRGETRWFALTPR
ncbi:MAG TPA: carbohydrate binding domain-containing protein [Armatimonadota bacterium]|nr:carbohydrate binding domain-containing protein [Armatimonadota bacterium]HPO73786.1 carbohydrate binding domain-containing protein [Armatimonadota bacterium]